MVVGAFVDQAFVREVIQHGAVNTALLEQIGIYPAHVFVSGGQLELWAFVLAGFYRGSGDVLPQQQLNRVREVRVEIFLDEIYRRAAFLQILIIELMAADGDVVIGPFLLRAGALQLLATGFEKGGEVGVLGVVELGGGEGDVGWDKNSSCYKI